MVDIPDEIRRNVNRGFRNPRRPGSVNPRVRGQEGIRGREVEGAPKVPKPKPLRQFSYKEMPGSWGYSLGEWIVYWYLTERKRFRLEEDFYHQSFAYAPFLYAGRDDTRADFLIVYGALTRLGYNSTYKALIFDPYSEFTHDVETDERRRRELADEGYQLIFMDQDALERDYANIIESGLKGRDLSNRGPGGI